MATRRCHSSHAGRVQSLRCVFPPLLSTSCDERERERERFIRDVRPPSSAIVRVMRVMRVMRGGCCSACMFRMMLDVLACLKGFRRARKDSAVNAYNPDEGRIKPPCPARGLTLVSV